ncbi:MAG: hypothetical protein AAGN35_17130 [Bacteroidota bacterium]
MAKPKSYTYEQIEPLIVSEEVEGRNVYCEFALPGSDEIFEAKASAKTGRDVKSKVKRRMTMIARNQARRAATRAVRSAVGGGMLGRTAAMGFNTAAREVRPGHGPSQKDFEEATVKAFMTIASNFQYDEETGEWSKADAPPPPPPKSPLEEQANQHPIVDPHDKSVFARVLAELAYADGTVTKEESEFFRDIIPPDQPTLDKLAKSDPVSRIEAQEVTQGVKATIYMFAWVIAAIDLDVDPVEEELLMEYADVFELAEPRRDELTRFAKYFVLEQNIDPEIAREELFEFARKIRLSDDEAERCRIAYRRRMG